MRFKNKFRMLELVFVVGFLFMGCWEYNPKTPPPPPPLPKVKVFVPEPRALTKGSLYRENGEYFSFTDHKSRRIGDIVTIKIVENYQSSDTVKQATSKNSSLSGSILSFLGLENKISKVFKDAQPSSLFNTSLSSSTSGQGNISRQSKIVATISARVVKVLPNGNLIIRGIRTLKRDKDLEYIAITGMIRPEDIAADNTVLSTQISDAYIEYSGKGPSSEVASGPGFITRLLHLLWPF